LESGNHQAKNEDANNANMGGKPNWVFSQFPKKSNALSKNSNGPNHFPTWWVSK